MKDVEAKVKARGLFRIGAARISIVCAGGRIEPEWALRRLMPLTTGITSIVQRQQTDRAHG